MNASLIISTTVGGASKKVIWDPAQPLSLGHPFRWVLEKTSGGVRIRDLGIDSHRFQKPTLQDLSDESISKGVSFLLNPSLGIRISRATRLQSAAGIGTDTENGEVRVFVRSGEWLMETSELQSHFMGTAQGNGIFSLQKRSSEYFLDALTEGVRVEYPGSREGDSLSAPISKNATPGQALRFQPERLLAATFHYGSRSWSFASAQKSAELTASSNEKQADLESRWYHRALRHCSMALGLFVLLTWLWPEAKPVPEDLLPAQFAKIVLSSLPKTASSSSEPTKSQTKTNHVQDAAVVQAFRAKALKNAVHGLLRGGMTSLLAQSDFVTGTETQDQARRIFDTHDEALQAASPQAGLAHSPGVKVASLGGAGIGKGAKGVGYSQGEHASVSGQGKSHIALDTLTAEVQEGLTKDEVGQVIHRHLSEVRYCYEAAMIRAPDIEGKLMLNFTIGGPGLVKSAEVKSSTLPDPRLDDCILRRLLTWKFPTPKGGIDVAVTYPFIFKTLGK